MFYVKTEIADGCEIRTEITDENVFSRCPKCGKEHAIDLAETLAGGESDLFGTQVFCFDCAKTVAGKMDEQMESYR